MLIAIAIHLLTLAILAVGVYVAVANFPQLLTWMVGLPLILLAVLLRPRFGSIRPGTVMMPRESAPALYGLIDRIAANLGARPVDVITFEFGFNAAYGQVGVLRRRQLIIGLALWNSLDDSERVAVIGHEMAHQVNGDLTHGPVVGTAMRTLAEWVTMAYVARGRRLGGQDIFDTLEMFAAWLAGQALRLFAFLVGRLLAVLRSLMFASTQRAEYFADVLAAQAGSTGAAVSMLDHLYIADTVTLAVAYAARRQVDDIWAAERKFVSDPGAKEWERLRRLQSRSGTAVDSTHPPTNLRIALLQHQPRREAAIMVAPQESKLIETEVESAFKLVAEQLSARFAV